MRLAGRGAWERGGFGSAPRALPCSPRAPALSLLRAQGCRAPQTAVLRSPGLRQPGLAPGSAPAARLPPPLHLGQRTPPPPAQHSGPRPARASLPLPSSFQFVTPPPTPRPAFHVVPVLADSALVRAGNFTPRLVGARYYCCYL